MLINVMLIKEKTSITLNIIVLYFYRKSTKNGKIKT